MKKDFDDCINLIQSEKIKRLIGLALESAPLGFWKDPCSGSGKYHPPEDQVEGGIVIHLRKSVQVAISLFKFFNINNQLTRDKVIAACMIHDIQKNGIPWSNMTDPDHGAMASRWLKSILEKNNIPMDKDFQLIMELVQNHMGVWNWPEPTPALKIGENLNKKDILHLVVQLADYWASRKWCPFVIDEFVNA